MASTPKRAPVADSLESRGEPPRQCKTGQGLAPEPDEATPCDQYERNGGLKIRYLKVSCALEGGATRAVATTLYRHHSGIKNGKERPSRHSAEIPGSRLSCRLALQRVTIRRQSAYRLLSSGPFAIGPLPDTKYRQRSRATIDEIVTTIRQASIRTIFPP